MITAPDAIVLGATYRDKVTGFQGVATARVEYLTGCTQIGLTSRVNEKGEDSKTNYCDWLRLEPIDVAVITLNRATDAKVGGPQAAPGNQL